MADELLTLMFREEWRNLPDGAGSDSPWSAVVAALNAGEPARARRLLAAAPAGPDPDAAAVTAILGRLTEAADRNWFPGGEAAVLDRADLSVLLESQHLGGAGPLHDVAEVVEALPIWRRASVAGPDLVRWALDQSRERLDRIRGTGRPAVIAPIALAVADLHVRSDRPEAGFGLFRLARRTYRAASDRVGLAACALALGDWAADLDTRPETLAELLEPRPVTRRRVGDPRRAEDHWAAAEAHYRAAGAGRGLVAVAVRRAAAAAADGRAHDAVTRLAAVVDAAAATRDGALAQLVAVHLALANAQAGNPVDHTVTGDRLAAWAQRDGSRSYARGLARLCRERGRRWQLTDVTAARTAGLLAQQILGRVGTAAEAAMLSADRVDRYRVLSLHRAALVLALSELDSDPATPTDRIEWTTRATFVESANLHANVVREPAALSRIDAHARSLLAHRPAPRVPADAEEERALDYVADGLERIVVESPVLGPLWAAADARRKADPDRARTLLVGAEQVARRATPLLLIRVLFEAGRRDEARDIVALIEEGGLLPAEHVAVLNTRVGRYAAALAVIDRMEREGGPHLPMKPWELPQLRAEALLGVGRPGEALAPALLAVAEVERHLAALDLDVFRSMATDDPVVAGVYTTAVRVEAALGGAVHAARSFERSDRSRAGGLGDLLRPESSDGPDPRAAVRSWQRAGAALARTVEEISAHVTGPGAPSPAEIRDGIATAERDLDAADATLTGTPGVRRRRLSVTPPLADIQGRLGPGTLLLQYHAYDGQLIAWAVTPDTARVHVEPFDTGDLAAAAFAFHRAASRPGRTDALPAAPLAPLLAPFTDDLRRCQRVVVVPHGPLAAVPFHALPFDGTTLGTVRRPVSYLPAASAAPDRPTGVRVGSPVLVVGDPAYGGGYVRLPGTRAEALHVARTWGTEACMEGDVTHATLMDAVPPAGLVHLATHGSFREGSPYSTELALAGTDRLTVPDLTGLGLRADLVVLSACDSGRGRPTAAGDLIGLTRALLAAGARELVVSLWPVDDQLACLTMTAFHEHLRHRPESVGAALAAAQDQVRSLKPEAADEAYAALKGEPGPARRRTNRDLDGPTAVRTDPADPCHWAPFVHIGTS